MLSRPACPVHRIGARVAACAKVSDAWHSLHISTALWGTLTNTIYMRSMELLMVPSKVCKVQIVVPKESCTDP